MNAQTQLFNKTIACHHLVANNCFYFDSLQSPKLLSVPLPGPYPCLSFPELLLMMFLLSRKAVPITVTTVFVLPKVSISKQALFRDGSLPSRYQSFIKGKEKLLLIPLRIVSVLLFPVD